MNETVSNLKEFIQQIIKLYPKSFKQGEFEGTNCAEWFKAYENALKNITNVDYTKLLNLVVANNPNMFAPAPALILDLIPKARLKRKTSETEIFDFTFIIEGEVKEFGVSKQDLEKTSEALESLKQKAEFWWEGGRREMPVEFRKIFEQCEKERIKRLKEALNNV